MKSEQDSQYGEEWVKEMMRCTKAELVAMIRSSCIHDDRFVEQYCSLEQLAITTAMFVYTAKAGKLKPSLDVLEKALDDAGQAWRIKEAQRRQV